MNQGIQELVDEARGHVEASDDYGMRMALDEIERLNRQAARVYVLTRLDSGIPVHGLYESVLSAARAFNARYFGDDAKPGGVYADMYGWEPYDFDKHADQTTDGLPDGAEAFVFNDEGDLVYIVGLTIQP